MMSTVCFARHFLLYPKHVVDLAYVPLDIQVKPTHLNNLLTLPIDGFANMQKC